MSLFPDDVIMKRRNILSNEILQYAQNNPNFDIYFLQCPCKIDCLCESHEQIPRISQSFCPVPGELDYYYLYPFKVQYGFITAWHCTQCDSELSYGIHTNHPATC